MSLALQHVVVLQTEHVISFFIPLFCPGTEELRNLTVEAGVWNTLLQWLFRDRDWEILFFLFMGRGALDTIRAAKPFEGVASGVLSALSADEARVPPYTSLSPLIYTSYSIPGFLAELSRHGANWNKAGNSRKCPLQIAWECKKDEVVLMLLVLGAEPRTLFEGDKVDLGRGSLLHVTTHYAISGGERGKERRAWRMCGVFAKIFKNIDIWELMTVGSGQLG